MIKFTLNEVIKKFKDYNRKNGVVYGRVNNSAPEIIVNPKEIKNLQAI